MIFSKLFKKKKWLSDKVSDRLAAIAELNVGEADNKSILHELAFNDGDDKVRRAALEKLNDFSLWWQAFKHEHSDANKKLSERILIDSLTGKIDTQLDSKLKQQFVNECNKSALLEKVVFQLNDESLTHATLVKLNKEPLFLTAINNSALSDELKLKLLQQVSSESSLRKLAKKLNGVLQQNVESRLIEIDKNKQKPIKIEKQARLILAQLNALRDKQSIVEIDQGLVELDASWQEISGDFDCLESALHNEFNDKYANIISRIDAIKAPLVSAWENEQAEQAARALEQENFEKLGEELSSIEAKVTQAIVSDQEVNQEVVTQQIETLKQHIASTNINEQLTTSLLQRAETIFQKANQVPAIKAAVTNAKELLQSLQGLTIPTDLASLNLVNSEFKSIRNAWQENQKQAGLAMPEDIASEYQNLFDKWQTVVPEFEKEQRQLLSQFRRKVTELEDLVKSGKYKTVFGLNKKLTFWYQDLNEYQKSQIDTKWSMVTEQVAKLQDLQQAISEPKKQELLAEIRKIAEKPLIEPTEQAHRVKMLRSNWRSLGHNDSEQDSQLNEEFNELCEQAFAPCREHYKGLEDERNEHFEAKMLLIKQLESLKDNLQQSQVSDWREVESLYLKLTKLWRETGLVDREKVKEINDRYHQAIKPIKAAIANQHENNADAKSALIAKAQQIVEKDSDLRQKSDDLKQLQNQWRKIGFAGRNKDQKLWESFRAVNNPVFEQRDSEREQQQAQSKAKFEEVKANLAQLSEQLQQASQLSAFNEVITATNAIVDSTRNLGKKDFEQIKKQANQLIEKANQQSEALRNKQEQQVFVDLFDAVEAIANGLSVDLSNLKPSWQTAINANAKTSRHEITLMLEIQNGVEANDADKALRNEVQMSMLTAKLEQGNAFNQQELLEQWLASGIFEQSDLALLERIKPLFLS